MAWPYAPPGAWPLARFLRTIARHSPHAPRRGRATYDTNRCLQAGPDGVGSASWASTGRTTQNSFTDGLGLRSIPAVSPAPAWDTSWSPWPWPRKWPGRCGIFSAVVLAVPEPYLRSERNIDLPTR